MKIIAYTVIGPLAVVLLWFLLSISGVIDTFFLPSTIETIKGMVELILSGAIIPDIFTTLGRVGAALTLAIAIGLPLGLMLGTSSKLYESMEFVIDFFRSIPATAMFPLFLLIFGITDSSKIAVAAFSSTLIILFNTACGVRHSKKTRLCAAKLMGASGTQIFKHISFWESLPQTFVGLRIAVSLSLIVIIVTEMFIGTTIGLGKLIIGFQYNYNIPGVYAVILLTGIIGYLINAIFVIAEKRFVHWTGVS